MIRNANRNISVSKGHGYTVEKVKYAIDFINTSNRTKTLEDWVNAYNHIKGTNETAKGCQACKAAKFTAAVRNYAQYGYLTLINEGHKPEEFKDEPEVSAETYTEQEKAQELNNTETSPETCNEEQQVPELAEASAILQSATENGCETEKQPETVAAFGTNVEQTVAEDTVKEVVEEQPNVRNKGGRPKKVKK